MAALITADNLSFHSHGRVILDKVSMQLHDNEILTIIGPNGAGKTTLLRILIGLMKPESGSVSRDKKLRIGYMPQKLMLNTSMPLPVKSFLKMHEPDSELLADTIVELGIERLYNQSMHQLSGGEHQRVLLARAILRKPDALVLDEPAQGVDIAGQNRLYELIDNVRKRHNCAVLMVSHDLHLVMANSDRVICLNQHICCHGHPDKVSSDRAYLSLFGELPAPAVAPYVHHHDHHHDLHGEVIEGEHGKECDHDF